MDGGCEGWVVPGSPFLDPSVWGLSENPPRGAWEDLPRARLLVLEPVLPLLHRLRPRESDGREVASIVRDRVPRLEEQRQWEV